MNSTKETKGSAVSIFAVVLVFLLSGVAGYYAVSLLPDSVTGEKEESGIEEPKIIVDPQIKITIKEQPHADSNKLFSLVLGSSCSDENKVVFELVNPEDSTVVKTSYSGRFNNVEPIEGGSYYARVIMPDVRVASRYFKINGFEIVTVVEKVDPLKDVVINVLSVTNTQKDNVFNVTVTSNAAKDLDGSLLFRIYSSLDGEQMDRTAYSSADGKFSNVEVKNGLKYFVSLELSQDETLYQTDYTPIDALKWKKPNQTKISKQEVETLINKKESLLSNKHFSSGTQIRITNPNEVSRSWTSLHNFIQQKFYWNSVSVDSLVYNQDNSVKTVVITVDYNE